MKKIYCKPTAKTVIIEGNALLSGSDVSVYGISADENGQVLSKNTDDWDDWDLDEE